MDEFYEESTTPEPELVFDPPYNRHYITLDAQGRITDGWSDGPHPERDTTGAICINEQGGYQFQLFPDGEENPLLKNLYGVYIYEFVDNKICFRSDTEINEEIEKVKNNVKKKEDVFDLFSLEIRNGINSV